jgi:chromosome segregation ATPase
MATKEDLHTRYQTEIMGYKEDISDMVNALTYLQLGKNQVEENLKKLEETFENLRDSIEDYISYKNMKSGVVDATAAQHVSMDGPAMSMADMSKFAGLYHD